MTTENAVPTEEQCDYDGMRTMSDAGFLPCVLRKGHRGDHAPVPNGSEEDR